MVMITIQHQISPAPASQPNPPPASSAVRSPSQPQPSLSLNPHRRSLPTDPTATIVSTDQPQPSLSLNPHRRSLPPDPTATIAPPNNSQPSLSLNPHRRSDHATGPTVTIASPLSLNPHRRSVGPTVTISSSPNQPQPSLSLNPHRRSLDNAIGPTVVTIEAMAGPPARVRLSDIVPYDGAAGAAYGKAVEALSGSLMTHNAAVIELGGEEAALVRCGLEGARLYFRSRAQGGGGKGSRGVYKYRAGRALEDWDSSPPCMAEVFRCMGKAARAALCAIARHLRLRSDVFNHLLDDTPLLANEASSSVLVATYAHASLQNGKGAIGGGKPAVNGEVEKGLLTLVASDCPGLQICDPNGRWYLAEGGSAPGDLLLLTGKALSHSTAGLRPAASYRASPDCSAINAAGRTSLAFRLMPQGNAVLDCSPIAAAGHIIPQSFVPISVSQFMDDLSAEEDALCNRSDNTTIIRNSLSKEPSLRSILSDPLSGAFLEDATLVSCGHSFGGMMLRRVVETSRCPLCNVEIEHASLVPNLALRAAAAAVKHEDDRRLFHNAALRKRRKEMGEQTDPIRRLNRENGDIPVDDVLQRGVHYPFSVNEKVVIKGNRRTPEKFVGKEAVITSQCLNGWYLLKILESGEQVRLQYRSLRKILNHGAILDRCPPQHGAEPL